MEDNTVIVRKNQKVLLEDDDDIILNLLTDETVTDTYTMDYPNAGYGGGELIPSPSGQYLVFSYFSGESEEAFLLLHIADGHLEPLYNSGYRYGEGTSYAFLEEEKILLETLRTGWWNDGTAQTDESGRQFYEFGEINLLDIRQGTMKKVPIRVYPPDSWEEESDEGEFRILAVEADLLRIETPWGEETVSLPLGESVTFTLI